MLKQPRECSWQIDGLALRGLQWGDEDACPVLALHGWQDNAASFAHLAPQLDGCHIVAPDLSGQGKSASRSMDATYNIWDDAPQIITLLDQLGWQRCSLLGHSRGAIMSTLLASALPERFERLVLLDAVIPAAEREEDFPEQFAKFLHDRRLALTAKQRRYATYDEAVSARARRGLPLASAHGLASRGLAGDDEQGWVWQIDPRLRGSSAIKLSHVQLNAIVAAVKAPTLILKASEGAMKTLSLGHLLSSNSQLQIQVVEGGHHFHMEPVVDQWVATILDFLGVNK
ncbi:MAG: alpha/beta fold hydrolase [Parahaliea sp.]